MSLQTQQIHHRSNGTIDVDFYRQQALRLRGQAMADCFKCFKGKLRLLLAAAVVVAPLALAAFVEPGSTHQAAVAQIAMPQPR